MNSVRILVPATLPGGAILPFLIYSKPGCDDEPIKGVEYVSYSLKRSLQKVIDVCQNVAHVKSNPERSMIVESKRLLFSIEGRSWELPLALGILSLFTNTPLKTGLTATGVFPEDDYSGLLAAVSYLSEKIGAAKKAGLSMFLLPGSVGSSWDFDGLTVLPVRDLHQAFEIASGIPLWRVAR